MDNPADLLLQRPELEAVVVSVQDPDKQMRVQVRVFGVFDDVPDDKLPWATYKLPIGARVGQGDFTPVQTGDLVWVDFPYYTHGKKDSRRPRITGSVHHNPDGIPNLPPEAFEGEGRYQHKRSHKEPKPSPQGYHESKVYILHGMMFEVEKGSVYRVTHMPTGTAFEFDARGHSILHVEGDSHHSTTGDMENHAGGNINNEAGGNLTEKVGGYWKIKVSGAAHVDAETVHFNQGKGDQTTLRGCDSCIILGVPHGQGSQTVFTGD
ncbi:phage baseplate assembly protein V [Vibrio parahaemolyticus]|uniref:phage baseplate assembly protein V n=1 Tax=Vibrio parahaemolyticus TaxID=670 RepID=UPI0024AFFDD4|nr:phage baseplate assembly protein V [Vibrio parahaemolyticus]MDI7855080.1 phage baseplate assembly protein V [Vibrio parahaemolyticus]